jgi:type VI secretion system secreted protein VgrG
MTVVIEAGLQLTIKAGSNFIDINPAGIFISGMPMVMINSGGAAGAGAGSNPTAPQDAKEAKPTKPDEADDAKSGQKSAP